MLTAHVSRVLTSVLDAVALMPPGASGAHVYNLGRRARIRLGWAGT